MKKLLAMVLALVMTLSLAVSANAFKDDKSISDDYAEAVAVLNGMGVFKGYEDGSFQPAGDITRAEVSAIVYRVYTQDVKDAKASMYATYNKFSDMAGAGWAQGYIGYCANAELVKGYPDGTFKPEGNITRAEVATIVYRIDTQMFFFHGFYNHSLELRRILFVWYSFWHSKTPHLLDSISYCLTNGVLFGRA